jgi:hypothetical protein
MYQGIIAFGLGHPGQSEEDVLRFVQAALSRGWNTFEICSETEFWTDDPELLPTKPRDLERLRWTLELLASVPGVQVALVGNCTLKRQISLTEQRMWAEVVALIVAGEGASDPEWGHVEATTPFLNVAIFTHNEFDNCRGRSDWGGRPEWCAGKQDVAEHIRIYRSVGIEWVTADDSFSPPVPGDPPAKTYEFRLANTGARPASFHPDREKNGQPWDPSLHQLQELARFNGLFVLSEVVAWMDYSGRCDGLRTCDQDRINSYIARCAQISECRFTFHSENGLAGEVPTWIPEAK